MQLNSIKRIEYFHLPFKTPLNIAQIVLCYRGFPGDLSRNITQMGKKDAVKTRKTGILGRENYP